MIGTLVNVAAIIIGGVIGCIFGKAFPEKMRQTVMHDIGLATLLIGAGMALLNKNPLIVIGSLVIGGIIGGAIDIELRLRKLGGWLEDKCLSGESSGKLTKAFVTTTLIYCVGAMAIMGALESGLRGNNSIIYA